MDAWKFPRSCGNETQCLVQPVMPGGALTPSSTRGKSGPSQCQALVQWALVLPWALKRREGRSATKENTQILPIVYSLVQW